MRMTPANATKRMTNVEHNSFSLRMKTARRVATTGAVWMTIAVVVSVKNLTLVKLIVIAMFPVVTLTRSGVTFPRLTESHTVFFKSLLTIEAMTIVEMIDR